MAPAARRAGGAGPRRDFVAVFVVFPAPLAGVGARQRRVCGVVSQSGSVGWAVLVVVVRAWLQAFDGDEQLGVRVVGVGGQCVRDADVFGNETFEVVGRVEGGVGGFGVEGAFFEGDDGVDAADVEGRVPQVLAADQVEGRECLASNRGVAAVHGGEEAGLDDSHVEAHGRYDGC